MNTQIFGRKTGLRVSELALGTGNFGTDWGHGANPEESRKIFDRYVEAGGNFIDTADGYQLGQSENLLGDFIAADRDYFVLASKYTFGASANHSISKTGNSRKNMIRSVEESLKRLKTDYLDVYWAHMSDGQTPIEEIVHGFDDLVRAGKILHPGFSNFPAWRIANASLLADLRGLAPVAGIQVEYSLVERSAERELLPMAEALGLGVTFWSPLGGGLLTGKYRTELNEASRLKTWGRVVHSEKGIRETAILDAVEAVAKETGAKNLHVALAWVRQKGETLATSAVTILGPRTVAQLDDNLAATQFTLTAAQLMQLDEASAIDLGSPHEVIRNSAPGIFGAGTGLVQARRPVA